MASGITSAAEPIRFAGAVLDRYRHVCAFFDDADEEARVLLPFVKEGLDRGEKAFQIIDPAEREAYLGRLRAGGVDADALVESGQCELCAWQDAYLRTGRFDQDAMLELIEEVLSNGMEQGYPLTRFVAHMEWSLENVPGVDDIVEYETRLNHVLPRFRDPVICVYRTARFGGGVVMDILRTHPMVIIGGVLRENPFFVPPDRFQQELRTRGGGHAAAAH